MEHKKEVIITKPAKSIKTIMWGFFGGITFDELYLFGAWFISVIGFGLLGWFTISSNIIKYSVIVFMLLIITLFFVWLVRTRRDKIKQWKYTLDVLKYTFKNDKKVLAAPQIYKLLNIERISENGEIEFLDKPVPAYANSTSELKTAGGVDAIPNKSVRAAVYKLAGVNVELLTNEEANVIIESMSEPWLKLEIKHKLIIVDEKVNIKPMQQYISDLLKDYENNKDDEIVQNQLINFREINDDVSKSDVLNKAIYLIAFHSNEQELNNAIREFETISVNAKISITRVKDKSKVCEILNQLYIPNSNHELFNGETKLGINKDLGKIDIDKKWIKINDQYTKVIEISKCPTVVYAGWLKKASQYQSIQTIVSIEKAETEAVRELIKHAKLRIKTNWSYMKAEGESYNLAEYLDAMEYLVKNLAQGVSKPWYVNISFIISADSEKKLADLTAQFTKELKSVDRMAFNLLEYKQYEAIGAIWNFHWKENSKILTYGEMTNEAIGAIYPFASNALKDPRGVFLGYETFSAEPFYFDLTMKEGDRNSNVALVVSQTGGGKTYTVSKLCNWFKVIGEKRGMKQYIVDPLGDYEGFPTNYENVVKIDMTNAEIGLLNPLHNLDDGKSLMMHAAEFVAFLSIVAEKTFSAKVERLIIETLLELYKSKNITDKVLKEEKDEKGEISKIYSFGQLKSAAWPTTDELYLYMKKKFNKLEEGSEEEDLLNIVWKLSKDGKYGKIWNGHTTLDTENANIIILDTHKLDNKDPVLYKCQMYLICFYLLGEALKNRNRNIGVTDLNKLQWINIVVDEAHRWIKNNPLALKTLSLLAREIRHHKGVLILATQNISDFEGGGEDIVKQAKYHIALHMTASDVASYDRLMKEAGGLTQNEKNFLTNASVGESLVSIGSKYRCYVSIKAYPVEEYMWKHGAK